MKIVIIGGGPAGMMSAISAKEKNPKNEVIILEKNNQLDLQEIDNELITKANEGNSFFKERLDVKEWLDYLEKNDKFDLNNKSMTA